MTKDIFDIIESLKLPESRKFHDETKIKDFTSFKEIPYHLWPKSWIKIGYKAYPRLDQVLLPKPRNKKHDFLEIMMERESCRNFSKKPVALFKFSDLIYYTSGQKIYVDDKRSTKRFYPSAGGRYPLEIYPFVFNVNNIKPAIYHYHIKTHSLELLLKKPFYKQTFKQFNQPFLRKSAVLFIITSIFNRTEGKYKNRGYRHILTEYGHLAQNFYLVSSALNLGCCSIGGFIDDGLNKILDIKGIDEGVVGVIAVGNKLK